MPRPPIEKLAARLAHLLNQTDDDGTRITLEPWLVEQGLLRILMERTYLLSVVGAKEMGIRIPEAKRPASHNMHEFHEAERAAGQWLRNVMDSARKIQGRRETHLAHDLLADLVQQGEGIRDCALSRGPGPIGTPDIVPVPVRQTVDALRQLCEQVGNDPAKGSFALRNDGPLSLHANAVEVEVIDPLSLWQAIMAAPQHSRPRSKEEMDKTVYLLRNAVPNANRHWDALRRLGLSPVDWLTAEDWEDDGKFSRLNANQALNCARMLGRAKEIAAEAGRDTPTPPDLEAAWAEKPVSAKLTFAQFAETPAGKAILTADQIRIEDVEDWSQLEKTDEEAAIAREKVSEDDLVQTLRSFAEKGQVPAEDFALLIQVLQGTPLADLYEAQDALRKRFKTLEDLIAHFEDLHDLLRGLLS